MKNLLLIAMIRVVFGAFAAAGPQREFRRALFAIFLRLFAGVLSIGLKKNQMFSLPDSVTQWAIQKIAYIWVIFTGHNNLPAIFIQIITDLSKSGDFFVAECVKRRIR